MAIDRPEILVRVTVPVGGWTLQINAENGINDITITATIPAGNYFVAWDQRADDFLWKLCNVVNVAFDAASGSLTGWVGRTEGMCASITTNHKINLGFKGAYFLSSPGREIKIEWTEQDGDEIAKVLGFDYSADTVLTGVAQPEVIGNYQHAYGWYADTDGELESLGIEPNEAPMSLQSKTPGGYIKTQYLGSTFRNELDLAFVPNSKMWSGDTKYGVTPPYPYNINEGLECWFKEVRRGVEFRVYRQNTIDLVKANVSGVSTSSTATTVTDSTKSWTTNQFAGRRLLVPENDWAGVIMNMRWYIVSNTATSITVIQQAEPLINAIMAASGNKTYYIFDQTYKTYVVDLDIMTEFAPLEIPDIDKFNISIPLIRFET